jgi:membrane fusion protein, multidrug efflux system
MVYGGGALIVVIAAIALFVLESRRDTLVAQSRKSLTNTLSEGPKFRVVPVKASAATRTIRVIGEARPNATVTLYAKTSGYLKSINVDRGDRVQAGAPIAVIESPETDKAYLGAKAEAEYRRLIATRTSQLLEKKLVSQQEADQASTEASVAEHKLAAVAEQQGYQTLRAPFSGTITARYADPGALVQNAGNSQTSALPVVTISRTDRLRVFIYLDQRDATHVRVGTPAQVSLEENQAVHIPARINRISGELDPRTRKLLAEIDLQNSDNRIVAGSFVEVSVTVPAQVMSEIPADALLVRGDKNFVAVIGLDGVIHFKQVTIARTDGSVIVVSSGVAPGEKVALNVGDAVAEGTKVRFEDAPAQPPTGGAR